MPSGLLRRAHRRRSSPSLAISVRQAVRELDPGLALDERRHGRRLVATSLAAPRYLTRARRRVRAGGAGAVGRRHLRRDGVLRPAAPRDIGIRLALGGEPADVRRMVVLQGMRLVVLGVAVGLGVAFLSGRFLTSVVFGISPTDPRMMIAVSDHARGACRNRLSGAGPASGSTRPSQHSARVSMQFERFPFSADS